MGAVYEATHARLSGRYAIKVLLRQVSEDPEALARFHREARITSLLQHPNVVEVIDYNTAADGTLYLVMEYLDGESLAQRLFREGPFPLDAVVGIIEQIAAGLAAAHAHGIVHRDLKPDNVFLVPVEGRETESVKILDFGISKVKGPSWGLQAPEGTLCGTPQYMSPEQVEGRAADVDAATDQFALAVLTYEMLTGRNPFQGDTVGAVFSQVLTGVPAPTGIGPNVDLVVRRGLAKANRQRFPGVTAFADALRIAAADSARESQQLATSASTIGEDSKPRNKWRARRTRWGLTLATTIVASLSMSFVAGGAAKHRSSRVRILSSVPAAPAIPSSDDLGQADFGQARPGRQIAQLRRLTAAPVSKLPEEIEATLGPVRPAIEPVVMTVPVRTVHSSQPTARSITSGIRHPTSSSATPRMPSPIVPFPADDDATLPLDETLGESP